VKTTYIAFLRAVNVGGRVVKMDRLRALFEALGLSDVRTHIQTGNVFFRAAGSDRAALARRIERHLERALGFEVPTMLRTVAEVEHALEVFEGAAAPAADLRLLVLFTSGVLPAEPALPLHVEKHGLSVLRRTERDLFVVLRVVPGRAGNPAALVEKAFGVRATGRFFHTTKEILAAAKISAPTKPARQPPRRPAPAKPSSRGSETARRRSPPRGKR
jgi:uncharacterized protein (DUF1697 family)